VSKSIIKYSVVIGISTALLSLIVGSEAKVSSYSHVKEDDGMLVAVDTPPDLKYPYKDKSVSDPITTPNSGGLKLKDPANVKTDVQYDPATGNYNVTQKMGDMDYRPPTYIDSKEYQDYMFKKQVKSYWEQKVHAENPTTKNGPTAPKLSVGGEVFDRIFGSNTVEIRPNGSAELIFAYNGTRTKNPALPARQQKVNTFDFNEKIQLNVIGKIGDKLKLTTSYNTEATFDFENQMKLEYTGYDDEIIKKIEAGNVSMPLNGSLITGSQTLFGVKTQLQFGRLMVTSIFSQQKGKKSEVDVAGGAQISRFEIAGNAYEFNKHYFIGQYFRDNYNKALANLPFVNSQVMITRIEVWVSNTNGSTTDIRNVIGFTELGEGANHISADIKANGYINDITPADDFPDNKQNDLYGRILANTNMRTVNTSVNEINKTFAGGLKQQANFELYTARKLQPSEYTLNTKLGYISLNQQLNAEQALSVAYQYTLNGVQYQVGEFSDGGVASPQALYTKILKSSNTVTSYYSNTLKRRVPSEMWNLMMKNVYSIGAYQVNSQDFKLDVFYNNAGTDINYLPVQGEPQVTSKPLLQVLSLDKLNLQNDQSPDGVFDFIDGVTINASNGRVIFPVVEPFGDYLRSKFTDQNNANVYVFDQLYDSTRTFATTQATTVDKFRLKGQYQSSSSSEISLGAPNVPQGSVTVTAGGIQLTENVDYTVDYVLGRVKIINDGILSSGQPIKVSTESNALFAIQSKTLLGTHLDYRINKDFTVGATILNLTERPITKKINVGDEPISNTIWGFDANYKTEAPFLTRMVDKIPLVETKETSTITAGGEFAYLVPGHSKAIGKSGNSYVDDFEGSQSTIDLKNVGQWNLASIPQHQGNGTASHLFPEGDLTDSVYSGYNRALLTWYTIDNIMLRQTNGYTPANIDAKMMSNNFMREIPELEIFPSKQNATTNYLGTLDLAYYPKERGPYNYDVNPTGWSAGLDANGDLNKPETRWGGIMRPMQTTDFEAANIDYIQFWLMDPFNSDVVPADRSSSGDLYFNIGNISEDVLRDNYKSAENVLPAPSTASQNNGNNLPVVETPWGRIPTTQSLVTAFNSDPGDRSAQDVGLDGLGDDDERTFFGQYLTAVQKLSPSAYSKIISDPSADDFHFWRGDDYDSGTPTLNTLERYKKYAGTEANTPVTTGDYPKSSASAAPNVEDINRDNNLGTFESYYQYHIGLKPSDFAAGVGNNYITDIVETRPDLKDGSVKTIKWYQFKIPLKTAEAEKFGDIENFQSIRFMRMFLKGVDKPIVLRFARLELVRGEWRRYGFDLSTTGVEIPTDDNNTQFDVSAVNLEENGDRQPVNYVLPPGIEREINSSSAKLLAINEQAMALTVCGLKDGQSRAAYKTTQLDVRQYKKLKMYAHAEASTNLNEPLKDNDVHMFIRLGTDYTENYYEYDVPLKVTPPGKYNGNNESDQYAVWPSDNEMILEFAKLQDAKQKRNNDVANGVPGVTLTSDYKIYDSDRLITIRGNPNLSAIRIIMIGVRNPNKRNASDSDDGKSKCAQIWVNELRLSDFTENGGWAANAHVTAKLADFANVTLAGNIYTPGFGSIENKVNERKKETLKQYAVSSTIELGKFIRESYNVRIPMYVDYSEIFVTPQFNPLDADIPLEATLKNQELSKKMRDSLRFITTDYTRRRSLNFTNVRKDKGKDSKKAHIYDIENWAATYSYSEFYKRNTTIEFNLLKDYHGGLIYSYAPTPKNIKPFEKIKLFQPKYLQLIKDVNFYLYPDKLGFSTNIDREYTSNKVRNTTGGNVLILPTYNKRFNMTRNYDFNYNLTKGLKINFNAVNQERILEPDGAVTEATKDTMRSEILDRIKKTQYNQQTNVTYTIPLNKIPMLDFITNTNVNYSATYNWTHSPLFDTQKGVHKDTLGNIITNSQMIKWSGQLTMNTLYNKIPYLKRVNQNVKNPGVKPKKPTDPKAPVDPKAPTDSTKKKKIQIDPMQHIARFIMGLKTVSINYSTTEGTVLPGYKQNMQVLGMDEHFMGPTFGFTVGSQEDIRPQAEREGWLVKSTVLNVPYQRTRNEDLKIRANVEPIKDLKIDLNAGITRSLIKSQLFRWVDSINSFKYDPAVVSGAFNMSFFTLRTSFQTGDAIFQKFLDSRAVISGRLGEQNPNSDAVIDQYSKGYNRTSQDVLIPAFLAAYSGKSADHVTLSGFPTVPKPNWRATYDGLGKKEKIKKYFKSITLANGYTSTYSIGGFTHNPLHHKDYDGFTDVREQVSSVTNNPNFLPENLISTVTISEQWSPFLKIDVTLLNSLAFNIEYKKDRTLSLGLSARTITEVAGREIVGGTGYRIKNVKLGNNIKIKGKPIKSDVNLNLNMSFRKNQTVIRKIDEEVSQPTGGTNVISVKASADYIINERITIKAFYDWILNIPVISTSFRTTNTNAGLSLRLTLSN
jgi:cell surface protein SprA